MLGEYRVFFVLLRRVADRHATHGANMALSIMRSAMTLGRAPLSISLPLRRSTIRLIVMDTHQAKGADTRQPKMSGLSVYSDNGMNLRSCLL
jgi:hypothetical protein